MLVRLLWRNAMHCETHDVDELLLTIQNKILSVDLVIFNRICIASHLIFSQIEDLHDSQSVFRVTLTGASSTLCLEYGHR